MAVLFNKDKFLSMAYVGNCEANLLFRTSNGLNVGLPLYHRLHNSRNYEEIRRVTDLVGKDGYLGECDERTIVGGHRFRTGFKISRVFGDEDVKKEHPELTWEPSVVSYYINSDLKGRYEMDLDTSVFLLLSSDGIPTQVLNADFLHDVLWEEEYSLPLKTRLEKFVKDLMQHKKTDNATLLCITI